MPVSEEESNGSAEQRMKARSQGWTLHVNFEGALPTLCRLTDVFASNGVSIIAANYVENESSSQYACFEFFAVEAWAQRALRRVETKHGVLKVALQPSSAHTQYALTVIKLARQPHSLSLVHDLTRIARVRVLSVDGTLLTVEHAGRRNELASVIRQLAANAIVELTGTAPVGLRGNLTGIPHERDALRSGASRPGADDLETRCGGPQGRLHSGRRLRRPYN